MLNNFKLKTILSLGEVDLLKEEDSKSSKYYIKRTTDGVIFNLANNWKSNAKNKYLTNSTKSYIVKLIKLHIADNEVKEFITWYEERYGDAGNMHESNIPSDIKAQQSNQEEIRDNLYDTLNQLQRSIQEQNDLFKKDVLGALAEKMVEIKAKDVVDKISTNIDKYIKDTYGTLPTRYEFILPDKTEVTDNGVYHKELPNIMEMITADIPIILTGPAGSGKNYTLEKAAELLKLDFYFTNAVTQEYKLTGFIDANGVYQETQFYKAFKNGGVFFLDEIDASIPEALIILNAAIANKYFDFPTGRINAHPDFRVVAAANTYGTGSDVIYVGRNVLDGATLDRFAVIPFGYDPKVEQDKCPDEHLYRFILSLRREIEKRNLRYTMSIRAMINAYKMLQCNFDKEYIIKTAITKSMTKDDIQSLIGDVINGEWKDSLKKLYNI